MTEQDVDDMFNLARKLCKAIQGVVNDHDTPPLALVMALRMLEAGYAPQIEGWADVSEFVKDLELVPKYKKEETN